MNKFLLRISLVASLLCYFLLGSVVEAQGAVAGHKQDERLRVGDCKSGMQQVKQYNGWIHQLAEEPEMAPVSALRPSLPSHRVASHRSVRLLPTHGGKPGQHIGR